MKNALLILVLAIGFSSCSKDNDDNDIAQLVTAQLSFNHQWDGEDIDIFNSSAIQYTNANGEMVSIERLRYLISELSFEQTDGTIIDIEGYHLVDIDIQGALTFNTGIEIPAEQYTNVSFRFGFSDTANIDGAYTDLNVVNWGVPMMLGGGYHYMQMEGSFINDLNEELNYQFHTIRAAENPGENVQNTDTSFTVNLGPLNATSSGAVVVNVDLAEWYKNPNVWNLNELYTMLMPNYDAQILMSQNGPSVFTRGVELNP